MKVRIECTKNEFEKLSSEHCIGSLFCIDPCPESLSCEECFKKYAEIVITDGGDDDGGSGSPE